MDYSKKKFLVVDDSNLACDFIAAALKQLGAVRIDKAENGQDALKKIYHSFEEGMPYALVTLDWEMPLMSGFELLKKIRADSKLQNLVVLMVSALGDLEHLKLLAPLQPSGYIVKPFEADTLKDRVAALLAPTAASGPGIVASQRKNIV